MNALKRKHIKLYSMIYAAIVDQRRNAIWKKWTKKIQEVTFDVEVQYCDPSDCYHDCTHEGVDNCDAHFTKIW